MHRVSWLLPFSACVLACSGSTAPSDVTGTWAAFAQPVVGSGHTMTITQRGTAVSGTGTYSVEAGRGGTIVIVGTYARPHLALQFSYDTGSISQFTALVSDSRIVGVEAFDGVRDSLTFTRQ